MKNNFNKEFEYLKTRGIEMLALLEAKLSDLEDHKNQLISATQGKVREQEKAALDALEKETKTVQGQKDEILSYLKAHIDNFREVDTTQMREWVTSHVNALQLTLSEMVVNVEKMITGLKEERTILRNELKEAVDQNKKEEIEQLNSRITYFDQKSEDLLHYIREGVKILRNVSAQKISKIQKSNQRLIEELQADFNQVNNARAALLSNIRKESSKLEEQDGTMVKGIRNKKVLEGDALEAFIENKLQKLEKQRAALVKSWDEHIEAYKEAVKKASAADDFHREALLMKARKLDLLLNYQTNMKYMLWKKRLLLTELKGGYDINLMNDFYHTEKAFKSLYKKAEKLSSSIHKDCCFSPKDEGTVMDSLKKQLRDAMEKASGAGDKISLNLDKAWEKSKDILQDFTGQLRDGMSELHDKLAESSQKPQQKPAHAKNNHSGTSNDN